MKLVHTQKDEVVVDVEAKLAGGEPNILLVAHTITGQRWGPETPAFGPPPLPAAADRIFRIL